MDSATQFDDQQALLPYLLPGERILWNGRPPTGFLFRKTDLFLLPFSLMWAGFAVFWEVMAWKSGAPPFFLVFGGMFVVMGVFFVGGRFFYDMRLRANTVYAITEGRALILNGVRRRALTALALSTLSQIHLELLDDGRGTITFGPVSPIGPVVRNPGFPGTGRAVAPVFERIENAAEVYRLLQRPEPRSERTV